MITDQKSNVQIEGAYIIGPLGGENIKLAVGYKPNLIRKFFMWLVMGWHWKTIKEIKEKNL